MCYKDELQKRNADKLQRKFEEDNVPDFVKKYFINIKSKSGCINYLIALEDFFFWAITNNIIGKNAISNIEPEDFNNIIAEDITSYLDYKESLGISPTTLETRKNILRSFWNYLSRLNTCEVEKDFFKDVSYEGISSNDNLIIKLPSDKQLQDMENKIMKKHDKMVRTRNMCVLRVLKGTGIRESELAGLDISNLYLDDEMPYVKVLRKGRYRMQQAQPVYLTGDAVMAIKEWLSYRATITNIIDRQAVFLNKNGRRFTEENIKSMFKTYGNGVSCHMLRHWYATVIAKKGGITFAQQQLGHRSANITINTYANGSYGMKEILANM